MSYLGSLVVYCDLVVLVRVFAGEKLLERFFDVDLETARLQGDFIWCYQHMSRRECCGRHAP
jgi:hypothetical protein